MLMQLIILVTPTATPYRSSNHRDKFIESLGDDSSTIFKFFTDTLMKNNADKCHLLVSTNANVTKK